MSKAGDCRACGRRARRLRPRRLCWACFERPEVRAAFPSESKFAVRSPAADMNGGYGPPAGPTDAVPGSDRKIARLAERAALGTGLWHEGDGPADVSREEELRLRARAGRRRRARAWAVGGAWDGCFGEG